MTVFLTVAAENVCCWSALKRKGDKSDAFFFIIII